MLRQQQPTTMYAGIRTMESDLTISDLELRLLQPYGTSMPFDRLVDVLDLCCQPSTTIAQKRELVGELFTVSCPC